MVRVKDGDFLCHFWEACCDDDGHSCVPENFICAALCMLLHRLVLYKIPLILEKTVSNLEVSILSKIVHDVLLHTVWHIENAHQRLTDFVQRKEVLFHYQGTSAVKR